jgi:signal transduction histidine kinase/ActR/RegA family two-component response regulator
VEHEPRPRTDLPHRRHSRQPREPDWERLWKTAGTRAALDAIGEWLAPASGPSPRFEVRPVEPGEAAPTGVTVQGDPPWVLTTTGDAGRDVAERAALALAAWRSGRAALSRASRRMAARTSELDLLQAIGRVAAEARVPDELFATAAEVLHEHEESDLVLVVHHAGPRGVRALAYTARVFDPAGLERVALRAGSILDPPPIGPLPLEERRSEEFDALGPPRPVLDDDEAVFLPLLRRGTVVGALAVLPLGHLDDGGRRRLFGVANQLSLHLDRILTVREAEQGRFRATLDSMPQAVFLADRGLRVMHGNRSAALLAESLSLPGEGGTLQRIGDLDLHALAAGVLAPGAGSAAAEARADDERIFAVTVSAVSEERDDPTAIVVVLADVTESRRLQQQLAQSEKMYSLGQMISGIAHELNNPLASIVGFSQLLRARGAADPKLVRRLDLLQEQAARCQKIVSNLLAFARGHEPERVPLSLNEVVDAVLSLMEYQLRVADIGVEVDLDRGLPTVPGDAHQLQQVLVNLMTNSQHAIRDAGQGGRVTVRTRRGDGVALLQVADDGPGIPESIRARIFDPFFTTKDVGKGTGLGLSLVYGIVTAHEGTIEVEGEEGGGTLVSIALPLSRRGSDEHAASAPHTARSATAATVLVVDDEASITELIAELLGAEGHRVVVAADGHEALRRIAGERFDLVISDMKMPGMGGERLVDELRRRGAGLAGRVLLTSGDTVSGEPERIARRAGLPMLHKPFDIAELVARVNVMLAEAGER